MRSKVYNFTHRNRAGTVENVGTLKMNLHDDNKAELYFYGDICFAEWESEWNRESKAPQDIVDFLADCSDFETIDIHINSGGGSVYGGLAIYHLLKRHEGAKTAYIDGLAASIASIIPFACDRVVCPKSSQIMIHKPHSWCIGNASDMRKEADVLDECQKSLLAIYCEHIKDGVTEEQIVKMIDAETWMTGRDAADIFEIEIENEDKAREPVDSAFKDRYNHVPNDIFEQSDPSDKLQKERLRLELEILSL